MRIVSILIVLTAKCYRFTDCDPLFCRSVFMCLCCFFCIIQACCINLIISLLAALFCHCIIFLSFVRSCFAILILFRRSLYPIICNCDGFFFCYPTKLVCTYISICAFRSDLCAIHCNILNLESIISCNLEVEVFSFCYFFYILIVSIIRCYVCLDAICSPDFNLTSIKIWFVDLDIICLCHWSLWLGFRFRLACISRCCLLCLLCLLCLWSFHCSRSL